MYSVLGTDRRVRVIFYYVNIFSLTSILIFIFTRTPYSHCAIDVGGVVYDAINGDFGCVGRLDSITREYDVYDTCIDADESVYYYLAWLEAKSCRYNGSTIFRYIFGMNDNENPYCTKAVAQILVMLGYKINTGKRVSFVDLLTALR